MKAIFEDSVDKEKFSMNSVYNAVNDIVFVPEAIDQAVFASATTPQIREAQSLYITNIKTKNSSLIEIFGKDTKKIIESILRFSFFIEPVKQPKIESTKFAVRWGDELDESDPRFSSYDDCLRIFDKLISDLVIAVKDEANKALIKGFISYGAVAYDLPIDYIRRIPERIHTLENIGWFWGNNPLRTIGLRHFLSNVKDEELKMFFDSAYGKIFVKAFLTDRVLTGEHKTNREKRWETHPNSVHFCLRKECMEIEAKLITQICYFDGFSSELQKDLEDKHLISFDFVKIDGVVPAGEKKIAVCPITLSPLSYAEFRDELVNPRHGKASYQVGHMHPLKAIANNRYSGHTADNISWISSQGNRVQGELSVEETRQLMLRIFRNYKDMGLIE